MPPSSSSGPSFGGSKSADIAVASAARFVVFSLSVAPNLADRNDRNIRPKRPSKSGEDLTDINPLISTPCLELMREPPSMQSDVESNTAQCRRDGLEVSEHAGVYCNPRCFGSMPEGAQAGPY